VAVTPAVEIGCHAFVTIVSMRASGRPVLGLF
jgi:hypothetical protein